MRTYAALLVAAAAACQVSAAIFPTEPVASTICSANVPCNVRWNDDGNQPALGTIGPCRVELCTGGHFQQTCLQTVSPSIDVSQNAFVTYNPDPSVGPTGAFYFIKFTSLGFNDPANPQFPFTAFSSRFTLNGMTGNFNATVMAQVTGSGGIAAQPLATSAPVQSPAGAATSRAAAITTTVRASTSPSASANANSTKDSGAMSVTAPNVVASVTGMTVFAGFFSVFLGMMAFGL